MDERVWNEQESLRLIEGVIKNAGNRLRDNSFYFLLWGWLVMLAALSEYILLKLASPVHYLGWYVMLLTGGVASLIHRKKKRETRQVTTYTDDFMKYFWTAFMISIFISLLLMSRFPLAVNPVLMMLYGLGTYVSGGVGRFKPLRIGGMVCWILAVAGMYVDFPNQLLLLALSVLVSYVVPGYLLKSRAANERL